MRRLCMRFTSHSTGNDRITGTLDRCSMVAFARDTPNSEEFNRIVAFIRDYLSREQPS